MTSFYNFNDSHIAKPFFFPSVDLLSYRVYDYNGYEYTG